MLRTARTLAILFVAPPVVLIALTQLVPSQAAGWIWYVVLAALGSLAVAGLRTSQWSDTTQVIVGILYIFAAIPMLPLLTLIAACTTGDCL
jgi:xanthine/uracil/vitamin C permease (AzgA family)